MNDNVPLPSYDVKEPFSWFIETEMIFTNIPNLPENIKFNSVLTKIRPIVKSLPKYIQEEVLNIISVGFQTGSYDKLKNALISEKPEKLDLTNKKIDSVFIALGKGGITARNMKINSDPKNEADISRAFYAANGSKIIATGDMFVGDQKVNSNSTEDNEETADQNDKKVHLISSEKKENAANHDDEKMDQL